MGKKRITMANEANEGGGKNEAKVAEKGDLIGFPVVVNWRDAFF